MIKAKIEISKLSKLFNVRVYYSKSIPHRGEARYWNDSITLSLNQSITSIISTFFHELGHIYCYRNKIWMSYHNPKSPNEMSELEKTLLCKTALRAERWVDNYGMNEMFRYYPGMTYTRSYHDQTGIDFLKNDIIDFTL